VDLTLYLDIDGNGVVDGDDYPVAVFEVDDGEEDPFGAETFVDDRDGAVNGAIETSISLFGVSYNTLHTIGTYVWEAVELDGNDNPLGTDTATFEVTQPVSAVSISGRVCDFVSGEPVPGAYVELEYFSDTVGLAPSVWADENGEFELVLPDGISTNDAGCVIASARGMLSVEENPDSGDSVSAHVFTQALSPGENALPDLYVLPPVFGLGLYRVQGTVYQVEQTEAGYETNALSGVLVDCETEDDDAESFSWDVSDETGGFSLVVAGDSENAMRGIWCEAPQLNLRGWVGTSIEVEVTGAVSGVQIFLHRPDALIRGQVTAEETGEPLTGVEVFAETSSGSHSGIAFTLTNGMYEIGLTAGSCRAECERDALEHRLYLTPPEINDLVLAQGSVHSNVDFEVERGYLITGHVFDTNDQPLADGEVVLVQNMGWEHWAGDTDVRFDGFYRLLSPTGSVYVRTDDFGDFFIDLYHSNQTYCALGEVEPLEVTTNGLSGIDFYLETGARVEGVVQYDGLYPAEWLRVDALIRNQSGEWVCVGGGTTEWGGGFGFAVPDGDEVYLRTEMSHGWQAPRTWYGGTCSGDTAASLALNPGWIYSGLNIAMYSGFWLNGQVLEQNGLTLLTGAMVTAFDASSNRYDTAYTDCDGNYGFYAPTNAPLVLYADANGYEGEFFEDTYDPSSARPVWNVPVFDNYYAQFVLYASGDDADGDGLADWLEDSVPDGAYDPGNDFSNPGSPDTDGDETGDLEEYIAGTNPQDPESVFEIIDGGVSQDETFLTWSSVAGRQYTLQICTNLIDGIWSNLYSITAVGSETAYTNSFSEDSAFLRVEVSAP
jgi:hypothetical protein